MKECTPGLLFDGYCRIFHNVGINPILVERLLDRLLVIEGNSERFPLYLGLLTVNYTLYLLHSLVQNFNDRLDL